MGARPLRRVIQDSVEDRLSDAVLSHEFNAGDAVIVDVTKEGEIILKRSRKRAVALKPGKSAEDETQAEEPERVQV
jgi:ATP-dependent Clp protease ATP-binding subunit ClpC